MNRFGFVVFSRTDRESLARPLAEHMANYGFKFVMSEIPPKVRVNNEAPGY
jgi:hypothetical protein